MRMVLNFSSSAMAFGAFQTISPAPRSCRIANGEKAAFEIATSPCPASAANIAKAALNVSARKNTQATVTAEKVIIVAATGPSVIRDASVLSQA